MTAPPPAGWQPLSTPAPGGRRGPLSRLDVDWDAPFPRLALCHLLSVSGETLVVLSLAGSFFFKVDPSQGREKVILGLLFTMAPFALVGPLIGPLIDRVRGGHRAVIQGTLALRALVAIAMLIAVVNDSIALFPEAFAMLVLAKTYQIAKAAVVPAMVAGELELVEANSKLQLLSGLAAVVAGAVGGLALLIGPAVVLGVTTAVFVAATVASLRIHPSATEIVAEQAEVDAAVGHPAPVAVGGLPIAAFSMGALRVVVGLLTFVLAFELRGGESITPLQRAVFSTQTAFQRLSPRARVEPFDTPPSWYFGAVIAASVAGGLVGAMLAPVLRRSAPEERILLGACALSATSGLVALLLSGLASYVLFALGIATSAALGKQAFDAVVQRDVEDSDRGRVFARFEANFQIAWVLGALVPSVVRLPVPVGAVFVLVISALATAAMATGARPALIRHDAEGRRTLRPYVSRSGKSGMSGSTSSSGSG